MRAVRASGRVRLGRHLRALTGELLEGLAAARHANGRPIVRLHGPRDTEARGATAAFTVLGSAGAPAPFWEVEQAASDARIALRGGCFCNPGCSEQAFGMSDGRTVAGFMASIFGNTGWILQIENAMVCHRDPADPSSAQSTIHVGFPEGLDEHLAHGDIFGICQHGAP